MAKERSRQRTTKGQKKRPVTAEEAERMFQLWCRIRQTQGFTGVAKVFKRSITTVRRVARAGEWEGRYKRVQEEVRRKSEKKIARDEISNLHLATQVKGATFCQLFKEDAKGIKTLAQTPTVRDFIAVAEFEQKLRDRFPDDGTDQVTQLTKDKIEQALRVFANFAGKKMWEALGHFIVDNDIRPDEPPARADSSNAAAVTTEKERTRGPKKRATATAA